MKTYVVEFYRAHQKYADQYVKISFQAADLERALSRVKKELHNLELLPNPSLHTSWMLRNLTEQELKN
jgi:hypothetical protein